MSRGGGRILVAVAALLGGCVAAAPPMPPPSLAGLGPQQLLEAVRRRESRVESMRAVFRAETESGSERRSSEGVLLVRKPDRFRMRLMMPLGLTVLDYVSWGDRTQLTLPLQDRVLTGPAAEQLGPFSRRDVGEAFLRGRRAFPGRCEARREAPAVLVICRDPGGSVLRRMRIDAATGAILEETSYEEGALRLRLTYDDYRSVSGAYLPYRIQLSYPQRSLSVHIDVLRYEVNPQLADALFEPLLPWNRK